MVNCDAWARKYRALQATIVLDIEQKNDSCDRSD